MTPKYKRIFGNVVIAAAVIWFLGFAADIVIPLLVRRFGNPSTFYAYDGELGSQVTLTIESNELTVLDPSIGSTGSPDGDGLTLPAWSDYTLTISAPGAWPSPGPTSPERTAAIGPTPIPS